MAGDSSIGLGSQRPLVSVGVTRRPSRARTVARPDRLKDVSPPVSAPCSAHSPGHMPGGGVNGEVRRYRGPRS
jgi:hypothetical protein